MVQQKGITKGIKRTILKERNITKKGKGRKKIRKGVRQGCSLSTLEIYIYFTRRSSGVEISLTYRIFNICHSRLIYRRTSNTNLLKHDGNYTHHLV
jgi:hypothetical protein